MTGIKDQNFGVEIEMTGITRRQAANALAKLFLTETSYPGGSYDAYEVKDLKGRRWKIQRDGSLHAEKKISKGYYTSIGIEDREYQVEMVTPKLQYEDIEMLQEAVRTVRKAGAVVNESCGIHVHVDAKNHTARSVRNLVNIMYAKEDMLFKALGVLNSRKSYCRPVKEALVKDLQQKKPTSLCQVADLWYKGCDDSRTWHYNKTRYAALNLHSIWFHGTVEFRLFNSTLHAGEVKAYVQLALAISAQAINQKNSQVKRTTSTNEKYTFRVWLLHLGFIGPEFETARLHLLKNLEGNCAWRNTQAK